MCRRDGVQCTRGWCALWVERNNVAAHGERRCRPYVEIGLGCAEKKTVRALRIENAGARVEDKGEG